MSILFTTTSRFDRNFLMQATDTDGSDVVVDNPDEETTVTPDPDPTPIVTEDTDAQTDEALDEVEDPGTESQNV
jgi:hypothetical protein